jgi:glycosyltransferase involved in cell wall biosynthesis
MRIGLVSSGSGSKGGGEIYLAFLAEGLNAAGHEVFVLIPDGALMDPLATRLQSFATVRRFSFRATYERRFRALGAVIDRRQQKRLSALFSSLPVDIIHINQQVAEDGLDLTLAAARSGKPWVSTIHIGHSANSLAARFGRARDYLTERTFRKVDADIIAVSASSAGQIAARIPGRLHVVLNGVPIPSESTLIKARRIARSDWGAANTDIVVGAVGRIEAQKAPLALVERLAPIAKISKGVRLVWIGDGSMAASLREYAGPHSTTMPLVIDGWRDDAAIRLAGLDVYFMPSIFEGLPLALLEAMHAGLPIIASHADGIAEAVVDGESGFLCETAQEWSDALTALVQSPELRARMGAAARQSARERFSHIAMANETLRVYMQVLVCHKELGRNIPQPQD